MNAQEEAAFDKKAEKMLSGYREFPNGRDFRCFKGRERTDFTDDFRTRYDETFPDAPGGSPRRFVSRSRFYHRPPLSPKREGGSLGISNGMSSAGAYDPEDRHLRPL